MKEAAPMLFSSMTFLWVFLPLVLLGSRMLHPRLVNPFLVLASLLFYAWGEPVYVLLMMGSIVLNWFSGWLLGKLRGGRKLLVALNVAANLLLLGYFKYLGMLTETLNLGLTALNLPAAEVPQIALPIGISFFTFQALSYVIDVYRGEVEPQKKLLNVALYISFFPQLIAGPIVRYKDVNEQIEARTITAEKFAEGIRRFLYGLGKKILLSNVLAQGADALYALDPSLLSGGLAWLAAALYTFQIYYDFSGYSDMAIGLGKMFGFDFCENFNHPYVSCSVREFWRRWHISLSTWFREYVYIPLGGNRKGTGRTYLNLMIVFLLTGFWHGASYSFVFWGLYHGAFQIIERLGWDKVLKRVRPLGWLYTMLAVMIGWVFFRVEDFSAALTLVQRMLMPWQYTQTALYLWDYVSLHTLAALAMGILGMGFMQQLAQRLKLADKWRQSIPEALFLLAVLVLCVSALASNTYNPFIYFRF